MRFNTNWLYLAPCLIVVAGLLMRRWSTSKLRGRHRSAFMSDQILTRLNKLELELAEARRNPFSIQEYTKREMHINQIQSEIDNLNSILDQYNDIPSR